MDLFTKFKEGYYSYLASVIAPAIINALTIPFFKRELGSEAYGKFSIFLNGALIVSYFLFGWIFQGILRYYSVNTDRNYFRKKTFRIALYAQLIFLVPVLIGAYFYYNNFFLSVLFFICIQSVSLQLIFLSFTQAALQSKQTMYAEFMRSIVFIGLSLVVIVFFKTHFLYGLVFAIISSYAVSFVFLRKSFYDEGKNAKNNIDADNTGNTVLKNLLYYGIPLSLWFLFASLSSFIDKLFMAKTFGHAIQGNYQAIFDLISKSISMLMTPVLTSVFPVLAIAYHDKNMMLIRALKRKIILYEIGGYIIVSIGYWMFGADMLFYLLKVPKQADYKLMGFLVVTSTFIWQIAMLVHKKFELKFMTLLLLVLISISFIFQISFYYLFSNSLNLLIFPVGNLIFSIIYLVLVTCIKVSKNEN